MTLKAAFNVGEGAMLFAHLKQYKQKTHPFQENGLLKRVLFCLSIYYCLLLQQHKEQC